MSRDESPEQPEKKAALMRIRAFVSLHHCLGETAVSHKVPRIKVKYILTFTVNICHFFRERLE